MRKGYYYILLMIAALLLIVQDHLKYSFGDRIFEALGISPWTGENGNGFHLSAITGLVLLFFGFTGVVRHIRSRYAKITSRLVIGCIAFVLLFPLATEGIMYAVKYNSHELSSIDISNSKCSVSSEANNLEVGCSFTIHNYGKVEKIAIKPLLPFTSFESADYGFESIRLIIDRHSKTSMTIPFNGVTRDGYGITGIFQNIDFKVEIVQ